LENVSSFRIPGEIMSNILYKEADALYRLYLKMQTVEIETRKFELANRKDVPNYEIGDYLSNDINDHRRELYKIVRRLEALAKGCTIIHPHCHYDNECVESSTHENEHCDECHMDCRCFDE
jgi:hypothetical protein